MEKREEVRREEEDVHCSPLVAQVRRGVRRKGALRCGGARRDAWRCGAPPMCQESRNPRS